MFCILFLKRRYFIFFLIMGFKNKYIICAVVFIICWYPFEYYKKKKTILVQPRSEWDFSGSRKRLLKIFLIACQIIFISIWNNKSWYMLQSLNKCWWFQSNKTWCTSKSIILTYLSLPAPSRSLTFPPLVM